MSTPEETPAEVLALKDRVLGGRYQLQSLLGEGGMGAVWRAQNIELSKPVAIKVIKPSQAGSLENRARFEREAQAAAKLTSQHIVDITDYGIDHDMPYIVMELLEGESLTARLQRRGRLPFDETVRLLSQVGKALTLAHEKRIVHRDLKPENVFIEGYQPNSEDDPGTTEVVKVLDFGIAKMLDAKSFGSGAKTNTGMSLGTPYYMSPEQFNDSSSVDHRTDIWSLGVMAYECVTGKRPFDAHSYVALWDVIRDHATKPPSHLAQVPAGFDEWFAQATASKGDERFASIKEALNQLRAIQGNHLTPAPAADQEAKAPPPVAAQEVQGPAHPRDEQQPIVPTFVVPPKHGDILDPGTPPEAETQKSARRPSTLQNTGEPSSVTSSRMRKAASSWQKPAAILVVAAGAVGTIAYFARPSSNTTEATPALLVSTFAVTPLGSAEVASKPSAIRDATREAPPDPSVSAEPVAAPVSSRVIPVEPAANASASVPTTPESVRPISATHPTMPKATQPLPATQPSSAVPSTQASPKTNSAKTERSKSGRATPSAPPRRVPQNPGDHLPPF